MTEEQREKLEAYEAMAEAVRNTGGEDAVGGIEVRISFDGPTDYGPGTERYVVIAEGCETAWRAESPRLELALRALAYLDEGEGVVVDEHGQIVLDEDMACPHAWPEGGLALRPRRGTTTYDVAQRVVQEYDPQGMGRSELTVTEGRWRLELSTGGWSDNEEWLDKASSFDHRHQSLWMWWTRTWQSTSRGGHYVFEGDVEDPLA